MPGISDPMIPIEGRRLSDEVAKRLEAVIVSGTYPIGAKLPPEKELAQQFGVGRSSMREAVRTLQAVGILRSAHGVGVFVMRDRPSSISPIKQELMGGYTVSDLFEARLSIEGKTAELAAMRLTDHHRERLAMILSDAAESQTDDEAFVRLDGSFHHQIAKASGNPLLLHMWESLSSQFDDYSRKVIGMPGRRARAHEDHCKIAEAISAGNAELASSLALEHVKTVQRELQGGI